MFDIGSHVRVASEIENDNYSEFSDKILVVTDVYYNKDQHPGYDESMGVMGLYSLETIDGDPVGCDLYEYELEYA